MQTITSRANAQVKNALRLRDRAAARRDAGLLFLEGARLCADAAASGLDVAALFVTEEAMAKYAAYLRGPLDRAASVFVIMEHVAEALSDTKTTQGIFCLCNKPAEARPEWRAEGKYLALESIRDPGNVGTLLRTAEAFGLDCVIHCGCGDLYGPKALRAGMGAQLRLALWHTDSLPALIIEAAAQGVKTFAAVPDADSLPVSGAFTGASLAAIGNEGAGLTPETLAACQRRVTIPMRGRAESLNAAAAGAVICWELAGCRPFC